jgi:hypothetical protein
VTPFSIIVKQSNCPFVTISIKFEKLFQAADGRPKPLKAGVTKTDAEVPDKSDWIVEFDGLLFPVPLLV